MLSSYLSVRITSQNIENKKWINPMGKITRSGRKLLSSNMGKIIISLNKLQFSKSRKDNSAVLKSKKLERYCSTS